MLNFIEQWILSGLDVDATIRCMHPETAKSIAIQHHEDLRRRVAASRRALPKRWRVSWSGTVLSADADHQRGSSLVIIISARRAA
ncbi:MAG TPA: hypothetical protein VN969_00830 [Streptosporangiaceae bacterium]|nr:hypothetical protein [Streptosporangiaceae bacterium]